MLVQSLTLHIKTLRVHEGRAALRPTQVHVPGLRELRGKEERGEGAEREAGREAEGRAGLMMHHKVITHI